MRNFRGLTKDGKMVYGNLIVNNAYDLVDGVHPAELLRTHIRERDLTWVNDPDDKRWTHLSFEVIPETVGQQIGRQDKNGNEIYEGDIVSSGFWGGTVEFIKGAFKIVQGGCAYSSNFDVVKIISNVHQNPELLEKQ